MDQYLDALEALLFLLDKMDYYNNWESQIQEDIKAWVHRKDARRHLNHYGGMGSFNDIGISFPETNFSIIKKESLARYFLDIQTITYTIARNNGNVLSHLKMVKHFGNFGMQLTVWFCNKCNIYEVYSDDVEAYIGRHYARKDVFKHYQDASLKKLVNERYTDDFLDIESKKSFFHVLISNAGISLVSGKYHRKCQKCDTVQEIGHVRCINCKSIKLQPYSCEPYGKVITFTTCYALPQALQHNEKVTFAIIELKHGGKILGQIWPPDSVKIGSLVEGYQKTVTILPDGTEQTGWVFTKRKNNK